jgi:hypothetical protein
MKKKLTLGMATYNDFDGVYFTCQALRWYHPELPWEDVEILVVDNCPLGNHAKVTRDYVLGAIRQRYVAEGEIRGTAVRDLVFREAKGEVVVCMDSHVMFQPGSLHRLLKHYQSHPETSDLFQGPLLADGFEKVFTHFDPIWRDGMFGTWGSDDRGNALENAPFEIPMMGLGVFSCRKDAWPGFNPKFRGFGGEEGYIHEKFRQAGGRTWCLPFFRWLHRFGRPAGVPYQNLWHERIRNYVLGWQEIGWDIDPIVEHFSSILSRAAVEKIVAEVKVDDLGVLSTAESPKSVQAA